MGGASESVKGAGAGFSTNEGTIGERDLDMSALLLPLALDERLVVRTGDGEEAPHVREERPRGVVPDLAPDPFAFRCTKVHFFLLMRQVSQRVPKGLFCGRAQGTCLEKQRTHYKPISNKISSAYCE
jgi:hypothetical protein